jgi:hypothetical protein
MHRNHFYERHEIAFCEADQSSFGDATAGTLSFSAKLIPVIELPVG